MYPHFFGFDMSAALPWFLMGFLLSACILGLWSFLSDNRRAPSQQQALAVPEAVTNAEIVALQETLAEMQADLDAARSSAMQIANEKVRIEADLKRGVLALASSAQPAQKDPGFSDQLAELQAELATAKASAVQYANEKSILEGALRNSAHKVASHLPVPAANPAPVSAALPDLDIRRRNEIADLNAELWALRRSDTAHAEQDRVSGAEIARLKAQLSAPSPADLEVKRLNNDITNWKAKVEALTTDLSNKSGFIAIRDAELDRLEALLANNNKATNVVPLNVANATVSGVSASMQDSSKLEAESSRLRAEVGRLTSEVTNKTSLIAMRDAELDRLETLVTKGDDGPQNYSTGPVSIADATRFTSEIMRLRALVDQTRSDLSDTSARLAARDAELGRLQGQTGQAAAYIAEHNHLRTEIARLSQQNAALNLDIANYQRVREALQEANRIASKG